MLKKILQIFVFFVTVTSLSQETKTLLSGIVLDSLGIVKNANIINIQTNQGTFSSDNGFFSIYVSEGDSLQISTIQHITKKIIISKRNLKSKNIILNLKSNTYVLDEFDLKRNHLTGSLSIDTKSVPTSRRDSLLNKVMDFSKIDMSVAVKDDLIDKRVRPPINETDPTKKAVGVGAGTSISVPFGYSERLWALRKELALKKAFPYKVMSELGEKFFFEKLKIPVDHYFHFLEYCNPLGVEQLHKENRILELIKIFQKESASYLKTIKE